MTINGSDPGLSTANYAQIQFVARGQFQESCCCIGPRTYFHVLENSIEYNFPFYLGAFFPNPCCLDFDIIRKMYFDRGVWENRSCFYAIGFCDGPPTFYSHTPEHVCLCMDCPSSCNDILACYHPCCCGDRLYYTPFHSCCCGLCSAKATGVTNLCGLCGTKTGEPLLYFHFIACLMRGSGEQLSAHINNARVAWSHRTNKA